MIKKNNNGGSLLRDIIHIVSLRRDAWLLFPLGCGKLPLSYPFMPLLVISLSYSLSEQGLSLQIPASHSHTWRLSGAAAARWAASIVLCASEYIAQIFWGDDSTHPFHKPGSQRCSEMNGLTYVTERVKAFTTKKIDAVTSFQFNRSLVVALTFLPLLPRKFDHVRLFFYLAEPCACSCIIPFTVSYFGCQRGLKNQWRVRRNSFET